MKPGRELDALVDEKVMGTHFKFGQLTVKIDPLLGPDEWYLTMDNLADHLVPKYSTDIAAAWLVVEKIQERLQGWFDINCHPERPIVVEIATPEPDYGRFSGVSDSLPHAICLAALEASGVEVA